MPAVKQNTKRFQVTQQGLEELKAELKELQEVKLPEMVERIALARTHGDLSENAEYQNAKEEQQLLEARISEIENFITKAQVVSNTRSHTTVGMGSTVEIYLTSKPAKTFTYTIVGEFEANPTEGKISSNSPLGKALMGKQKSDKVEVKAPAGTVGYVIKEIK